MNTCLDLREKCGKMSGEKDRESRQPQVVLEAPARGLTTITKGTRAMANSYSIPSPKKIQFDLSEIQPSELPNNLEQVDKDLLYWLAILQGAQKHIDILSEHKIKVLRRMPYQEYLQTDHWKHVRKFMLEFADNRCQLCNTQQKTLHVHHRTYENRGCENVGDLIVLCADCHQQFHDKMELAK